MSSNPGAEALNVAVVRGIVSSDPKVRSIPSGDTVTNVEVMTRLESGSVSVPVVVHARSRRPRAPPVASCGPGSARPIPAVTAPAHHDARPGAKPLRRGGIGVRSGCS